MASFSETLDLAEEEDIWYLIVLWRRRRQQRKRLWSVHPMNRSREEQGKNVLVNQKREMDEEQHCQCFWTSEYRFDDLLCWITLYIRQRNTHSNPAEVLQRPAVALQVIWVTCVVPVDPQSHPFCEPIFFSSASKALFYLHGNDRMLGPANQSKCETIQNDCDIASFNRCKKLLDDTFLCLFLRHFCLKTVSTDTFECQTAFSVQKTKPLLCSTKEAPRRSSAVCELCQLC